MNVFLELMHDGLSTPPDDSPRIDTNRAFAAPRRDVPRITSVLTTAFPVRDEHLQGTTAQLACSATFGDELRQRFERLRGPVPGLDVRWEPLTAGGMMFGTVQLGGRQQPFSLHLRSFGSRPLLRCVSPIGRVSPEEHVDELEASLVRAPARLGAILSKDERSYDLTVEDDVLLADDPATDPVRLSLLLRRVASAADALEYQQLDGRDQPLDAFRRDLERDGGVQ
jgi:hypothetical protein